jgi:outer membrane receptor for ferric coprogen and ferric-rhodotorulic acid
LLFLAAAAAAFPAEARRTFDLPAGDAADTLRQFAQQAGREVVYPADEVRGQRTNAVRGSLPVPDALRQLLAGTALNAEPDRQTGAFAVRRRAAVAAPSAPAPTAAAAASSTVVLSPFEVNTAADTGYAASTALSATRTNEPLANLPNSISVITADFMSDLALTDFFGAVEFAIGAENQYNGQGTVGAPGGSRSGNQINFRGLPSVRQLRDGFPWYLTADAFNTERIEFSRGPGGLAYGDVDPGGIINVATKRASFRRRGSVSMRWDDFGGERVTLDVNQPLAPRLGVRLNAVASELEQSRQRNNRNLHGWGGAVRWDPFAHGRTRVEAAFERGHTVYQLGHLRLLDAAAAYVRGSGTNAADADPVRPGVQVNGVGMRRTAAPGNTHSYIDIGGTIYDLQSTATTTFRNSIVLANAGATTGADPQNPEKLGTFPIPRSIIPEPQDWGGPDNRADSRYHALTIEVSHAFSDRISVLLAHNIQRDDSSRPQTYSAAQSLGTNSRNVFIDVNRVLPHPTIPNATIPNPRFEEYFVAYGPTFATDGHDIAGTRTAIVLDPRLPWAGSSLRFILGGSYRREQVYLNTFTYALAAPEIARRGLTGTAATFPNNLVYPVHYLRDGNNDAKLRLRLDPNVVDWYRSGPGNNLRFDQTLGSGSLSTIGAFFGGKLRTSVGVSRDYFRQNRNRDAVVDAATGEVRFIDATGARVRELPNYDAPVVAFNRVYGTNRTFGGVYRVVPWLGVGAGHFESTLFTDSASIDLFGGPRLPRTGRGQDYSLRGFFLQDRVTAVLTHFRTTAEANAVNLAAAAVTELNGLLPAAERLAGGGDYRDQSARGWEFELQSNLRRNWTLRASYSMNRTRFESFFPLTRGVLERARAAASARGLNPDTATQVTRDFLFEQEGATGSVRRETANLATRYAFEGGRLKGLSLGGSVRYTLGVARGALFVADNQLRPAARAPNYYLVSPFAIYRRKIGDLHWSFQLNVNNLLDHRSNQFAYTLQRYVERRQWIFTTGVEF